jgi:[ribosomal protein S5]-alanine N-acetyltransferase
VTGGRTYFLTTDRLQFSHWNKDDLALAASLWGNPRVFAYIGGPFSDQQIAARLELQIANQREHSFQYWPVFTRHDEQFAGCAGLRPHGDKLDVLEMGFHFRPEYWGQGFALEAGRAVIAFAFATLAVTILVAGHHPENLASGRVLTKLGFQFTHDEFYPPTGVVEPNYLLGNPLFETSCDRRNLAEGNEERKP